MIITFRHVDEEYYGVEEIVRPVAELTVIRPQFICIVCGILNIFHTYSARLVSDVKKALKLNEYRLDKNDKAMLHMYCNLTNLIEDFYWNVVDDEFGRKIKAFNEKQYWQKGMRYPDKRLGQYRGLLFEEIVVAAVEKRYTEKRFCTGCQIYINSRRVIALYGEGSASHKETIDIAGWDDNAKNGEFYECKINPERFRNENYRFFMELKKALDVNGIQNYQIGLVSADTMEHLKAQKRYLEEQDESCKAEFMLIGREDIYNMQSSRMPELFSASTEE